MSNQVVLRAVAMIISLAALAGCGKEKRLRHPEPEPDVPLEQPAGAGDSRTPALEADRPDSEKAPDLER